LVNGETAVAINEFDNAIYTGITSGTQAELLAAISDSSNWFGSNSTRQTMPTNPFTVISEDIDSPVSTPEPTAIFSLLALGVAVISGALKQRQYK
ncbi:MAG: hypothetical protein F6K08_24090, partial [Okeania sp. SIO1H6]|nr:hypothetical protein [Okeania sp. SIO1H6]